jgi:WD40 repeat protein/serine/threonine protein kinase
MPFPDRIGRYDYRGTIGVGGFAVVLRCYDEALDSHVAVKVLADTWAIDPEIRGRFVQEAKLLRRIHNEHVVTVHDSGELNDGRPYFVMDYADRGTLEDRLGFTPPGRPIDAKTTRRVVLAVTDGLAALHRAGIVHRDIKPGNLLLQSVDGSPAPVSPATEVRTSLIEPAERILIGDLGLAKDLVATPSGATIIGGTHGFQPPEQCEPNAAISPAADVYAATGVVWRLVHGSRPPDHRDLARALTDVVAPWRELFEQGFAPDPEARFASIETWRDALLSALDAVEAPSRSGRTSTRSETGVLPCPYKGLAAYEPEDSYYFFGREALIDQLVRRLRRDSVLVVGGPSGSGKSSLVRAGLVPAVADGALPGSQEWRIALFTPGTRPLSELHYQLTVGNSSDAPTFDQLRANPALARHASTGAPLLLCIDQFEELFTLCRDPQEQDAFVEALAAHLDPADSRSRAVIVIRADFYGECARFPWLTRRITDNQVLVGPMDRSELRRAIEQPARQAGLAIESGLIDAILDEAGEESGSLPLVAHALVETWARRRHNTLTVDGFRAAGGVAGAIAKSADTIYDDELDDAQRDAARRLLLRLVTPGEDSPDTRRRMTQEELAGDEHAAVLRPVITRLTAARLLTVDDRSIAIAHEALIRTWPRFRAWIDADRENLLVRQRISRAAVEWKDQSRDPDLLLRGTPLAVATEWAVEHRSQLNRLEQEFLDAGVGARDAAAHAAQLQADRRRRARRSVVGALAVLTVAALLSASLALASSRRSRVSERRADAGYASALAATGERFVGADPYLAMMLAMESAARTSGSAASARGLLVSSRQSLAGSRIVPLGSEIDAGNAEVVALDPRGELAATGQRDGGIRIWDLRARKARPQLTGHTKGIEGLDFSPDGTLLASGSSDRSVRLWPVRGHEEFPAGGATLDTFNDIVWEVRFSPDGSRVAAATEEGIIRVYDVDTQRAVGPDLATAEVDYLNLAFSPDGRTLAAGNGRGELSAWDLATGARRFGPVKVLDGSDIWELTYARDGATIVTASSDARAHRVDASTGTLVADQPTFASGDGGAPRKFRGIAFGPEDDWLIAATADGDVRMWDNATSSTVATTELAHRGEIYSAALSRDASKFVTLGSDEALRLWDVDRQAPISRQVGDRSTALLALAVNDDGSEAVTGDVDGVVRLRNLHSGASTTIAELNQAVGSVALSRDGTRIAAGAANGAIDVWRRDGTPIAHTSGHLGQVKGVAFTGDGSFVSGGEDGTIRFWTTEGRADGELPGPDGSVTGVVLSRDGKRLAAAGRNGTVRVWDAGSHRLQREIAAEKNTVWGIAFSPDGTRLATASDEESAKLWDVTTGKELRRLTGHPGGATDVRFSPDGRTVLVASKSGPLRLWDSDTGEALGDRLMVHTEAVWHVAWLPGSDQFVSASEDGTLRRWDVLSTDRACALASAVFDADAQARFLGPGQQSRACRR